MGTTQSQLQLGFLAVALIGQSLCWHGWSLQPATGSRGALLTPVRSEAHGRLTRFNDRPIDLRTPWLHITNPAIQGRQEVDYGMRMDVRPMRVEFGIFDIVKNDITNDGFKQQIRNDLERILRQGEIEYVRNSHSAYVRQTMGQNLRGLTDRAWNGMGDHFRQVQMNRLKAPVEHLKKEIEASAGWKKAAPYIAPVGGAAVAAYALYSGQPLNWSLPGGFSLGTQQNIQAAAGSFSLGTPWFTAAVNYSVNAPDTRDPTLPAEDASEKVQVYLGHTVPVVGINTTLSYATTTGTISAALSRGLLIPNLSGSVKTTRSLRATQAGNYGEEVVDLNYVMSF